METREILSEREKTYGDYTKVSWASQDLKAVISNHSIGAINTHQRESLDMICNKIARIICGDPEYKDSWADISGYATLSADRCKK